MRIIRFLDENGEERYGHHFQNDMATLLEGQLFDKLKDTGRQIRVKKLLAPLQPSVIFGIGLNYRHHAIETGSQIPKYPVLFTKNPAAVTHPNDPIVLPLSCLDPLQVDYEVELAVVIGKPAKNVPAADALDYVLGYTVGNDVSARRWQKHGGAGQWVRGKSFDTFCPLGPVLVTPDEIPDPQVLQLKCILNNQLMQDNNTADMIFSVVELIEYMSCGMTLLSGTVILTGTPGGVGFVREPAVYLKPGDVVEASVENIGRLVNPVVSGTQ
jgi:2-keto-4-pentenoate hydratase/2-oxohepta-3-ene-1,7-dioic acid hydratase in catechol pathway